MNSKTINSFSARTVDRLTSARRATLTMLATFLIAMTAQTAWAQTYEDIGTIKYNSELGAYEINCVNNLNDLAVYVNGSGRYATTVTETTPHDCKNLIFKMTADIDFNTTVDNNFTPIGTINDGFYGTFDGQGHTISGIRINKPGDDYLGVFGYLGTTTSGVLKNLVVRNSSIDGDSHVGVIAGKLEGGDIGTGIIENCHVGDDVTIKGCLYVGGIAGISNKATIGVCTCAATIIGKNCSGNDAYKLGGIIGEISGGTTLYNNIFTGTISGDLWKNIGAIVGNNANGDLNNLGNNVYTSTGFHGIGAEDSSTAGTDPAAAKFAYLITAGKNVTVDFNGAAPADTQSGPNGISIYDKGMKYANYVVSYSTSVNLLLSYKPGFIVTGYTASAGTLNGTAHTGSNDAYTLSTTEASTITAIVDLWGDLTGDADGTEDHPYILSSPEALDLLAERVNSGIDTYSGKFFKLGADIEYDPTVENNFTPIGYRIIIDENNPPIERPFRGHFDGNGKTISGINLNNSDVEDHGIFGYLYGTVKNLVVNNCSIVADHNIGAIVGVLYGTIENCHVGSDVTLSGHSYVGGIAGWCAGATIKGCTSAATITGTNSSDGNVNRLGGIVGETNIPSSSLTDNLFTGAITGDLGQYIGAIFGCGNEYATLTNNVYTSAGFGGIGAEGSATGSDGAGARKAVVIGAAEGVTITPTGEATTYTVSGITTYKENTVLGYDSKLYAGATDAVKLSIANTGTPETGYEFSGFTAGEGVTITSSENVYTLTVPASDVTVDVVNQAIIYNITYKGVEDEGVTFTEDNPEAYTVANESFTLSNPSREGYLFMGWTYEGQTEPTKTVTIAKGSTGDKTFTANWEKLLTNTDITVSTIADQTYTGSEIKPAITVKDGTTDITDQCDFTYNSNKVVGTAEVVISAKESSATYAGEKTVTFKIAPKTVSTPTITLSGTSFEYTGEAIKPTVTVKDGETTIPAEEYTVGYSNNIEDGTATVTITDNEGGNYTVSGTATFTITPKPNTAVVNVEETPVAIGGEVYYKSTEDIYEKMMYKAKDKGISIGLSAKASNRIEVTAEGVKFSKGTSTTMAMLNLKFGDIIKLFFRGIIRFNDDGSIFIVKSLTRGDGDTSSDGMIDLVSGAEYKVLKDGALVLTIVLENEEAVIEGISVTRAGTSTDEPTSIVVTAKNKYWTFSCDQDVKVPEGVKVYTCQLNSKGTKAIITELSATELGGVIKANNGVLLSSDPGDYTFVFSPETTSTVKTYENNALVAVVKPTHLSPNDYYVLKDSEFHVILDDETEVPANKAVLKKPTGASGSRAIGIDEGDDATRIWGVGVADEDAVWYTVSGQRIDKPTKKGLYIKNGVKVVVK